MFMGTLKTFIELEKKWDQDKQKNKNKDNEPIET